MQEGRRDGRTRKGGDAKDAKRAKGGKSKKEMPKNFFGEMSVRDSEVVKYAWHAR